VLDKTNEQKLKKQRNWTAGVFIVATLIHLCLLTKGKLGLVWIRINDSLLRQEIYESFFHTGGLFFLLLAGILYVVAVSCWFKDPRYGKWITGLSMWSLFMLIIEVML